MAKYKAYPEYKESGVEWLGEVPEHWEVKPLKYLIELNPSKSNYIESQSINCSFIPMEKLKTGSLILDEQRVVSDVFSGYTYFENGDVLQAKVTPCFENKNIAVAKDLENGVGFGSSEINVFRPVKSEVVTQFLYYRCQESSYMNVCTSEMIGAGGLKRVPSNIIENFSIALPCILEQEKIANFLDHETAKIDTLIEKQEKLIELLQEKRNALTLSGYSTDKGWLEERLENVVNIIKRPVYQKDGESYVALGLYNRGRGLFHKEPREKFEMGESDFFWVDEGDLVISGQFAWEGSVALTSNKEINTVVSHRYPILRGKEGVVITEYIYALLTTSHGSFLLNENSRGAAGRNRPLNINALMKEKIKIPPLFLQQKIADLIHTEEKIKDKSLSYTQLLKERRTALISAAVTGKIDVRDVEIA